MKIKKILSIVIIVLIVGNSVKAQSDIATDSLLNEMCNTLKQNKDEPDSVRFFMAYIKHLEPHLMKMNQAQQEKLFEYVYIRLQRNCKEFFEMLTKDEPVMGDWEIVDEKPASKLDKAACNDFNTRTKYFYREPNGDTVKVVVDKGMWQEEFIDGSYSKLKFRWIGDCEFELEFISSDNKFRKNLSKKGETYRYILLEKVNNYYSTLAQPVGLEKASKFKIYY